MEKSAKPVVKSAKGVPMSDTLAAQQTIKQAFPASYEGENIKGRISRAARKLGVNHRRARAIWNGEARRIDNHEMKAIENAKAAAMPSRVSSLRQSLETTDQDFFQPEIAALERIERTARRYFEINE